MRYSYLLIPLALTIGSPASATEQWVSGTATVIDGDTLDFSGVRVRLFGIDAPEPEQSCLLGEESWNCGGDATALLSKLVEGRKTICQSTETDDRGRLVAVSDRDGLDLGLTMVEGGLAIALENGPERYTTAEALRKTHRIGIWASEFQMPAQWRAENPQEAASAALVSVQSTPSGTSSRQNLNPERVYRNQSGCAIKGNRNRRGEWIYHLPSMQYYDQTRPEELFCTEIQARNAGYRRSKV